MSVESRLLVGLLLAAVTVGLVVLWWLDPDGWWRK